MTNADSTSNLAMDPWVLSCLRNRETSILYRFPEEVLLVVLEKIRDGDDLLSLFCLRRVSRLLRRLVHSDPAFLANSFPRRYSDGIRPRCGFRWPAFVRFLENFAALERLGYTNGKFPMIRLLDRDRMLEQDSKPGERVLWSTGTSLPLCKHKSVYADKAHHIALEKARALWRHGPISVPAVIVHCHRCTGRHACKAPKNKTRSSEEFSFVESSTPSYTSAVIFTSEHPTDVVLNWSGHRLLTVKDGKLDSLELRAMFEEYGKEGGPWMVPDAPRGSAWRTEMRCFDPDLCSCVRYGPAPEDEEQVAADPDRVFPSHGIEFRVFDQRIPWAVTIQECMAHRAARLEERAKNPAAPRPETQQICFETVYERRIRVQASGFNELVTVTPATRTYTTTRTVTSTNRNATITAEKARATAAERELGYRGFDEFAFGRALEDRQLTATATSTPAYASPCSSVAAFSSACSCLGISHATTTVAAELTTSTFTLTKTVANATVPPFPANHTLLRNSTAARFGKTASSKSLPKGKQPTKLTTASKPATAVAYHTTGTDTRGRLGGSDGKPSKFSSSSASTGSLGDGGATKSSLNNSTASLSADSTAPTIHVLNTTTITTTIPAPFWANTTSPASLASNSTYGRYVNSSTAAPVTSSANATSYRKLNATVIDLPARNTTAAAKWLNATGPGSGLLLANSTRPVWLNTSMPTQAANSTAGRWLNTTATATPANTTTTARWLNTTAFANTTTATARWLNTTTTRWLNTSTPTSTPTATTDSSCGETASPFALQVAQPGGVFDGWFVALSGDGLLFTRGGGSAFSVEASGHLCAVGLLDGDGRPAVAAVGKRERDPSSAVWLLQQGMLAALGDSYSAVRCVAAGELVCAAANVTGTPARHWLGCGIQLDLSTDEGAVVPARGLNCTALALKVVV
ncbi:hypothetical protein B0T24DRAFT_681657 [Lasiosphaeria ovina]|uniref:F-box domain-containing protein n=1 Tax=Lasiosphaeria ovina TaxID=92902 RepID=A0AAE0N507_9PEZI|nr:hypothetical protein B0T24DRAFT_681657 [Lasiosphaeria ovina]